jgi:hypothetical protein
MKKTQRHAREMRDGNMKLQSDEEVERESTAETAERLSEGDEYLDLEQLVQGALRTLGS